VKLDTETLVLDLRSLTRGINAGVFTLPLREIRWDIEEVEPAEETGTLELSADLEEGTLVCTGRFDAVFLTPCARCLEPARFDVREDILRKYSWLAGILEDEDMEMVPDSGRIQLLDALREAVILSIPGKPLCAPDCPGIDYI
jgi:uncharacterized protein